VIKGRIEAVARSADHRFSKSVSESITLVAGIGVDGDAHAGVTVKHRSRVRADPTQANLRQVHLVHRELFDELAVLGFKIRPGDVGENITTQGIDLLRMSRGTRLRLGPDAVIEVTGLRNPCAQLDAFATGLMSAMLDRDEEGRLVRKAGVMAIVCTGGTVTPGDHVYVEQPVGPHLRLEPV
jgi:MOSC domain-containing protein YiiM